MHFTYLSSIFLFLRRSIETFEGRPDRNLEGGLFRPQVHPSLLLLRCSHLDRCQSKLKQNMTEGISYGVNKRFRMLADWFAQKNERR